MIERKPDWLARLNEVIGEWDARAFSWGDADCCVFVSACVEAMAGVEVLGEYRGAYTDEAGAWTAISARDGSLRQACRRVFGKQIHISRAHRGDVVMQRGMRTIGICVGGDSLFVGGLGLIRLPTLACVAAFPVGWTNG